MRLIFHAVVAVHAASTGASRLRGLEYDYSHHGQDWAFGSCASRSRQSPIDLPASATSNGAFSYQYSAVTRPFEVQNNGHTLAADLAGQGYGGVYYENAWYNLMNVNVHAMSEHTWMGAQKPIELHLVHKRYDSDALLVVAVAFEAKPSLLELTAETHRRDHRSKFSRRSSSSVNLSIADGRNSATALQAGPAPAPAPLNAQLNVLYQPPSRLHQGFNPDLQAFLKAEPPDPKMKVLVPVDESDTFDLNNLMGEGSSFYEYAGSLTAPPCAENVVWLARRDVMAASAEQIRYLRDSVYRFTAEFGNYRSVMPLNGRMVYLRQGRREDNPPTISPEVPTLAPTQSEREMRAMKWAKDALRMAKSATDYIKDLDFRLRAAAQAHAAALAPQLPSQVAAQHAANLTNNTDTRSKDGALNKDLAEEKRVSGQTPQELEVVARKIAGTMAEAFHGAVEQAVTGISDQAEISAKKAATEAAQLVEHGYKISVQQ